MWKNFWQYIMQLFGKKESTTSTEQQNENQSYDDGYMDISNINFTAIFANKLATSAVSDSEASIAEDNQRCELLNRAVGFVWPKMKKHVAAALGTGGCILVPYVKDRKIYYNAIKQNRLLINERDGEKITGATVLADSVTINNNVYYRFVDYSVVDNALYITNKTSTQYGAPATVPQWENIPDMAIQNVDRVLFGYIKSPIDNRKNADEYGVPITYGCGKTIKDIKDCLEQIREEFELKQVRLQMDERAFNKDPKTGKPILTSKLFMKGHSDNGDLFNIFDPAIRESSYHARLDKLFELFEKQVGTSRGILTTPETHGATATEIRAANQDTFSLVSAIRKSIENGLRDYIYACDVLANYYNLTPPGEYALTFDWSYAMIESTTETWQQMKDLQSMGGLSKAELRAWQTGETLEDAQAAVEEIAAKEPSLSTLLGMDEGTTPPRQ